jgi:hypothetical protein
MRLHLVFSAVSVPKGRAVPPTFALFLATPDLCQGVTGRADRLSAFLSWFESRSLNEPATQGAHPERVFGKYFAFLSSIVFSRYHIRTEKIMGIIDLPWT